MSVTPPCGFRHSSTASADALHQLADRVDRLVPSHHDPHAYFEAKAEIVHELRELAQEARR